MNWLRKIGNWLWLNKERMVLAVMVAVLVFRVYQVLNPPPLQVGKPYRIPGSPEDGIGPGLPPPPPPPELTDDWSRLWRRVIWRWDALQGAGGPGDNQGSNATLNISLVQLREITPGDWRARIRTQSRTSWYELGEQFEQYTLMEIEPGEDGAGCVTIFSDPEQRNVRLCTP